MMKEPDPEAYSGSENLEVMADAVNYNGYLRSLVSRYAGTATSVLDFGAGIGTFTEAVAGPGRQVTCVEPDAAARRQLEAQGYRVADDIKAVDERNLDYIFSLNVLEHIEDGRAALQALHDRLRPGGVLFIYVPAFNHLRTSMDDLVGHHRRYTLRTLTEVVESAGLVVEEGGYTDFLGYFATLLFRLMDLFRSSAGGTLSRPMLIAYDRVAFPVSRWLSRLFRGVMGKNVYVVATRPV